MCHCGSLGSCVLFSQKWLLSCTCLQFHIQKAWTGTVLRVVLLMMGGFFFVVVVLNWRVIYVFSNTLVTNVQLITIDNPAPQNTPQNVLTPLKFPSPTLPAWGLSSTGCSHRGFQLWLGSECSFLEIVCQKDTLQKDIYVWVALSGDIRNNSEVHVEPVRWLRR